MQKLIFILVFQLSGTALSQKVLNTSLVAPEVQVAYRGLHNHLRIEGMEVDSNTVIISGGDTLERMSDKFIYKVSTANATDTLKIYNPGYITQVVFSIEYLGKPRVLFGEVRDTLVTKAELLANPGLICTYYPYLAKMDGIVLEFEAYILRNNGKEVPLRDKLPANMKHWPENRMERYYLRHYGDPGSNKFSKSQLKQIRRMKMGETIWFTTAVVRGSCSKPNRINLDLRLTVQKNKE